MAGPPGRATRPRQSGRGNGRPPRSRVARLLVAGVVSFASAGCAGIKAHDARLRNAVDDIGERIAANLGADFSPEASAVLARQQLLSLAQNDPVGAARLLEDRLQTQSEPDAALALAQLFYNSGVIFQTGSPSEAMTRYRDAAIVAALAVADPAGHQTDLAVELHNRSLARMIRLAQTRKARQSNSRNWRQILEAEGLAVSSSTEYLEPERIGDLRVASDYRIEGMGHIYRTSGLGVPLVAHRWTERDDSKNVQEQFFPREMRIAATAILSPGGGLLGGEWRRKPATLQLLDPFAVKSIAVGHQQVILATDTTTPLATQVSRANLAALEWTGLLESNFERLGVDTGLYMLRPYEPGKIPVVFVHGLVSSPRAWVQVINELQNTPELAAHYQFWLFMYPTGRPIPGSAARLRQSLIHAREMLDPDGSDAAFDHTVMVGHSMGGILSKMMAQDSELQLWNATITIPRDQFKAPPEFKKSLDEVMIFRPVPFVSRLVFIATPHRGSPIADSGFGQAVANLVRRNVEMDARIAEVEALNGPDVISPEMREHAINAISNLRTDSPILGALDRIRVERRVRYHSIIPLIGGTTDTDGVVEYRSSHLEGAASELIFAGTHISQQDPPVIRELDRILREHLATASSPANSRETR
jgi:pimeloyl-ACP methyl ester carboxylesterase